MVQLVKTANGASSPANQPRTPRPPCPKQSTWFPERSPTSHSVRTPDSDGGPQRAVAGGRRRGREHPFPRPASVHAILARRPNSTGIFRSESRSTQSTQTLCPQGLYAKSLATFKKPISPERRRRASHARGCDRPRFVESLKSPRRSRGVRSWDDHRRRSPPRGRSCGPRRRRARGDAAPA